MGSKGTPSNTPENRKDQLLWLEGYFRALLLNEGANKEQLILLKQKIDEIFGIAHQVNEINYSASWEQTESNKSKTKKNDKKVNNLNQSIEEFDDDMPF